MGNSDQNVSTNVAGVGPVTGGPTETCVVVLNGQLMGKRFGLRDISIIGRSSTSDLAIDGDPTISRTHVELVNSDEGYVLRDLHSTSGTFVNGHRITEEQLHHDDIIRIGDTLLRFLCKGNTEAAYHDEVYRLTTTDPLTGAYNKRYFINELYSEVSRCTLYERPCSLAVIKVQDIEQINRRHGNVAGDSVLREVVRQISAFLTREDLIGRTGGLNFAILLTEHALESAQTKLEDLSERLSSPTYSVHDGTEVEISVSAGIASLSQISDREATDSEDSVESLPFEFLQAAKDTLYAAQRRGETVMVFDPNRDEDDPTRHSGIWRRPLSQSRLIELIQSDSDFESVVACELVRDKQIINELGFSTWKDWNGEFINTVSSHLGDNDQFMVWNDSYVIAALHASSARDAGQFEADIRNVWNPPPDSRPSKEHDLRESCFASLTGHELENFSEDSLATLIGRLDNADDIRALLDELPYPISILYTIPPTRRNSLGRVRAMIDVLDVGYRFLAAIAVSILFDLGDDDRLEEMAETMKTALGRSPSLGAWLNLAFHLARLLPQTPRSAAHQVALSLLDEHENSSEFKKLLHDAVALRNDVVHGRMGDEEAYEDAEAKLSEAIAQLVQAVQPLADTRLVSVDSMQFSDDPSMIDYELRLHRGPTAHFPIIDESFTDRLVPGWCYLIDSDDTPLSLTPFLFVGVCEACNRAEMFLTEKLVFGPKGKQLKAKGLTTNHEARKKIAWTEEIRRFYDLLD